MATESTTSIVSRLMSYTIIIIVLYMIIIGCVALGFVDIAIGMTYMYDACHISYLAPYLVLLGPFCIISTIMSAIKDADTPPAFSRLHYIIITFVMSIAIWGMTLVWDTDQGNCPVTLYNYAYYRTIVSMFISVAIVAIGCCACSAIVVCGCCGCVLDDNKSNNDEFEKSLGNLKLQLTGITDMLNNDKNRPELTTVQIDSNC